MKVSLTTGGGQAAALNLRLPPRVVDTSALAADAASELAQLVTAAKSTPAPKEAHPGKARDAMTYKITIEDGGTPVVLTQSDTTMSKAFVALRDWIRKHSAAK